MKSFSENDFTALYEQTKDETYKFILKRCRCISDIDDLFQETYIAVYRYIDSGKKIDNGSAFVKTVAKKTLARYYSFLRRKTDYESELTDNIPSPEGIEGELADRVYELILKKPEKIQKIFYMRHTLCLSFDEIARLLKMSEGNVKSKYYKAKEDIKRRIEKEEAS